MKEEIIAKIEEILNRGTEDVIDRNHLKDKLVSGKKLRIKFGIDPTGPKIHLGRAIPLRKVRALQDLGHTVVLIIGDFTATIGDPSDKLAKRPILTREDVTNNMAGYLDQIGKIVDVSKAEIHYNSEWLSTMSAEELISLAESFSIQQMISRRNFKDRIESGQEVSLRESLYPILQGYDSVMVRADVEVSGFDQLFNVMAGRTLQKHHQIPQQDVLTTTMLEGTDGRKMSTSWGNVITILDEPREMFGKIMSVRDDLIVKYFTLCTSIAISAIQEIEKNIQDGSLNPRDAKLALATEIVRMYHSQEEAEQEHRFFIETFSKKNVPEEVEEVQGDKDETWADFLVRTKSISSKSEAKRLIDGGGVEIGGQRVSKASDKIKEGVLKVGKSRFLKIIL
jgi:tyrosyl-tRNA synthetase